MLPLLRIAGVGRGQGAATGDGLYRHGLGEPIVRVLLQRRHHLHQRSAGGSGTLEHLAGANASGRTTLKPSAANRCAAALSDRPAADSGQVGREIGGHLNMAATVQIDLLHRLRRRRDGFPSDPRRPGNRWVG